MAEMIAPDLIADLYVEVAGDPSTQRLEEIELQLRDATIDTTDLSRTEKIDSAKALSDLRALVRGALIGAGILAPTAVATLAEASQQKPDALSVDEYEAELKPLRDMAAAILKKINNVDVGARGSGSVEPSNLTEIGERLDAVDRLQKKYKELKEKYDQGSEIYLLSTQANPRKEKYRKETEDVYKKARERCGLIDDEKIQGVSVSAYRADSIKGLLAQFFTRDIARDGDPRLAMLSVIAEKLIDLKPSFQSSQITAEVVRNGWQNRVDATAELCIEEKVVVDVVAGNQINREEKSLYFSQLEIDRMNQKAEQLWKQFASLQELFYILTFFNLDSSSLIMSEGTVREEEVIKALGIPGAVKWSYVFAEHPLVGMAKKIQMPQGPNRPSKEQRWCPDLDTLDYTNLPQAYVDATVPEERPKLGLVGEFMYAAYHEMRKPKRSDGEAFTTEDSSRYSRNAGFTESTLPNLVAECQDLNQITLYDTERILERGDRPRDVVPPTTHDLTIGDKMLEYPEEAQETIKYIVAATICRYDLATHAGRHLLGFDLGSFKFEGGEANGIANKLPVGPLYHVGKNGRKDANGYLLAIADIDNSDAGRFVKSKSPASYRAIEKLWEQVEDYERYENPQSADVEHHFDKFHSLRWCEIPTLTQFFMQTGRVEAKLVDQYKKGRDSLQKIVDMAIGIVHSVGDLEKSTPQQLGLQVDGLMEPLASEIAKASSYFDTFSPIDRLKPPLPGEDDFDTYRDENPYAQPLRLILASLEQYVASIMMAVPSDLPRINLNGEQDQREQEYVALYNSAGRVIAEKIIRNSSITPLFVERLLGRGRFEGLGFLYESYKSLDEQLGVNDEERERAFYAQTPRAWFAAKWRDEIELTNEYNIKWGIDSSVSNPAPGKKVPIQTYMARLRQKITPPATTEWGSVYQDKSKH